MKFVLGLLLATLAVVSSTHVLYTRTVTPKGWSIAGPTTGHESINFMVALKQQNLDVLEQTFWEVSDPTHDNYQNFMTPAEIMSIIAPEHETVDTVKQWLHQHGCRNIKDFGDALEVHTTVNIASKLFSTTFHHFVHEDGSTVIRQWGSYSIPTTISKHVDMITGLSTFPIPHYKIQKPRAATGSQGAAPQSVCTGTQGVAPQSIYSIYEVREETMAASNQTSQGVIEFQGQSFQPTDLTYFAQQCNISAQPVLAANIIGPNNPLSAGDEAELDIQLIATVNIESTNWFWLEDGNGWLYTYGVHFFNTKNVPQVVSISYGWWEGAQCDDGIGSQECAQLGVNSQVYVTRVNTEFQKIGNRGISILAASGDSGANGRTNSDCSVPQLRAAFPGSSPYVTGVGATQLNTPVCNLTNSPPICNGFACPSAGQEVAVSYDVASFASGGGFSNFSTRPDYQAAAVGAYLKSGVALPPASYFNANGRGYPDVAAVGNAVLMFQFAPTPAGGTSASTPIFAALVALLNEISIEKTGNTLGFINPLLYQAHAKDPTVFHDITIGDNKCTEDGCSASCAGYLATKGWDPVTGLGSPNFAKLSAYVTAHLDAKLAQKKHHHHHHGKKH